jgi:hypothetical protein
MEKKQSFLSRRKLIMTLGGTATAGAALLALPMRTAIVSTVRDLAGGRAVLPRAMISLGDAGYDVWFDQIGSIFSVGGGTSLKLVAVTPMDSVGPRPNRLGRDRAFLAKFDVQNRGTMAGDLIYAASHPLYGALRIFLSASTDPRLPQRMTALFN